MIRMDPNEIPWVNPRVYLIDYVYVAIRDVDPGVCDRCDAIKPHIHRDCAGRYYILQDEEFQLNEQMKAHICYMESNYRMPKTAVPTV